ncbi:MAG: YceI family protein [Bacteroidia bacterium]
MKAVFFKLFIFIIPVLFLADNGSWKVKSSAVTFKIKNAGLTVDGSFTGLEADIKFDPLKPENATIKASVDAKSINTGNDMRNGHLRKEEYFNVDKFPKITLQSVKIEKTGPITYNGVFNLTMKGVTKPVMIPFTFMKIPEKTELKGTFTINRRDYGVGGSSMTMADDATVTIVVDLME